MASIQFLGAAGTVTGSRHLIEHNGRRVLLDCGLFQGLKELRKRNWDEFPVAPRSIDAVVLSHAHIDHTGWLPRLVRQGFKGRIYATPATRDLAAIMLPDSGRIQEEDADYANRKGYSKHSPALPLYTEDDAVACIPRIRALSYDERQDLGDGIAIMFRRAGHILGSAVVHVELDGPGADRCTFVYSGDLGRYDSPIIPDPDPLQETTYLLVECTYGDRRHADNHPEHDLKRHVLRMVEERGVMIIPAFAIGRTQGILYSLRQLQLAGEIPEIPTYVDSPMACDATALYLMHREEHDEAMMRLLLGGQQPIQPDHVSMARSVRESKAIAEHESGPLIIVSASGMATGGRVLHHLKQRLPDPKTTVLFAGYQAVGTRGRRMLDGEKSIRIHGKDIPINARIGQIYGFSAHADQEGIDRWLSSVHRPPTRTFCVHGEPGGLNATHRHLEARGWPAYVPVYKEKIDL